MESWARLYASLKLHVPERTMEYVRTQLLTGGACVAYVHHPWGCGLARYMIRTMHARGASRKSQRDNRGAVEDDVAMRSPRFTG